MLIAYLAPPPGGVVKAPPPMPSVMPGVAVGVVGLATLLIIFVALSRLFRRAGRGRQASFFMRGASGVGNALHEVGAMLQPQAPNIESIQKAEEHDRSTDEAIGDARNPRP